MKAIVKVLTYTYTEPSVGVVHALVPVLQVVINGPKDMQYKHVGGIWGFIPSNAVDIHMEAR